MPGVDDIKAILFSGGWVMIPLFFLACLLYANVFTLLLYTFRTNLGGRNELAWSRWVAAPETGQGRVGEIIRYTQQQAKSVQQVRSRFDEVRVALLSVLDRRVRFLNTLVAVAPLLGLLGTVIGMLSTFYGIALEGGNETFEAVASGIKEALVTTQTGLMIALPALFGVLFIRRRKHAFEVNLARLESVTLTHLSFD